MSSHPSQVIQHLCYLLQTPANRKLMHKMGLQILCGFRFIFIFLMMLIMMPMCYAFVCEEHADCLSLLQFKKAVKGDPDGHIKSWNTSSFFCNWTGITCHPLLHNRVASLELAGMRLNGRLTPFISNLSALRTLSLQENDFHGPLPTSIGELSELSYFNVSWNELDGEIPSVIHRCENLTVLDLSMNNFSGSLPVQFGRLKNLVHLVVAVNNLSGTIPPSLSNLTKLTNLKLSVNYFTGRIPPELGVLRKLEVLYLHTNPLVGPIPSSLSNCTSLREVSLIENNLSGNIPSEFGYKLLKMERLYLWGNKLNGHIPISLSNLSRLTLLDVSVNQLDGPVPVELGRLKKLERLYFHSNNLISGSDNSLDGLFTALTNCSLLQKLHMASCLFEGSLPASVGGLSKDLFYLNVRNNRFTSAIPDSIGNLTGLVELNLWYNNFSGAVPATFGKLQQLQRLNLGRNLLTGSIPDEFGDMVELGSLDLGDNQLSGSIPAALGKLSQLRYLQLYQNQLSGRLPAELSRCSLLMMLDLSHNKIKGPLPPEIGELTALSISFNLSNNNIQGELPTSLGRLVSVEALDLSENRFSGAIPDSIGKCIQLQYLNLSHNQLESEIPNSLEGITYLRVLDLAHNNLTGIIPYWIINNRAINTLNLAYNKLTGEVPNSSSIRNLTKTAFEGNIGLCSSSNFLGLPPCETRTGEENIFSEHRVVIILSAIFGAVLIILCVAAICFRRALFKRKIVKVAKVEHCRGSLTLSQREIEVATNGFNESNLLGKGSFGSVYRAVTDGGATIVAVKVLHQEHSENYNTFRRECRILSGIKHRNLVKMLGSTWNPSFKAIILEYIGNGNLEDHLYFNGLDNTEGCRLPLRLRVDIAMDIAHGLDYLHESCSFQVVHRDLKPQNILLDKDMVAHIADFGIAKLVLDGKPKGDISSVGFIHGSIGYIPPESAQGMQATSAGDVYSLGVIILEMMTLKRPTDGMFSGGHSLRKWVTSSQFPSQTFDVVDAFLREEMMAVDGTILSGWFNHWCTQMLEIGLMSTADNPHDRPLASDVARRLNDIHKEMQNVASMKSLHHREIN